MQQATYRPRPDAAATARRQRFEHLDLLARLLGEVTALASLGLALSGSLLIAASYLL